MLTGIFSPTKCAECKLCCNFHRSSAWETPALESADIFRMHEMCVPLTQKPDGTTSFYLDFRTENPDEIANCPLLDTCSGCILPRENRPFECRIWPLRIMRDASTLVIGIYENCPALDTETFNQLSKQALENLLEPVLAYARRNPRAVRNYDSAYKIIWRQ